jgi:hypothetical protein
MSTPSPIGVSQFKLKRLIEKSVVRKIEEGEKPKCTCVEQTDALKDLLCEVESIGAVHFPDETFQVASPDSDMLGIVLSFKNFDDVDVPQTISWLSLVGPCYQSCSVIYIKKSLMFQKRNTTFHLE